MLSLISTDGQNLPKTHRMTLLSINKGIRCAGLLATNGTVQTGVYARMAERFGLTLLTPDAEGQQAVMDMIYQGVKAGKEDFDVAQPDFITLRKNMEYIERKAPQPSEKEISDALKKMGKLKPEDELNCGSCGYNTCREKAIAIIEGKAEVSMCLPFLKERAENFSDNIINNTPNGIVVLNEDYEVQQINRAALKLMNIPRASDVMGEPIIRILDPKPFMDVQRTGRSLRDSKVYLAEYDKYVEQTIVFDKEYKALICIMRDVTEEEEQKQKKEDLSRQTVETADRVVDKQMRIVQEIASLLGETAAETKIALTKLKESMTDE